MDTAPERRDRALERSIRDLFLHDDRVRRDDVEFAVDGGVVHLWGRVGDPAERALLRRLLVRLRGIHAVWDVVRTGDADPVVVDIGCGRAKQYDRAIGIDAATGTGADVVADLRRGIPLAGDAVDHVFAVHVLEHVPDTVAAMTEIHRVLRGDGVLHVLAPYWRHTNAIADPTHVRFFGPETFLGYCLRRPGITPFRPLAISCSEDTVFADLQPVKDGNFADERSLVVFAGGF